MMSFMILFWLVIIIASITFFVLYVRAIFKQSSAIKEVDDDIDKNFIAKFDTDKIKDDIDYKRQEILNDVSYEKKRENLNQVLQNNIFNGMKKISGIGNIFKSNERGDLSISGIDSINLKFKNVRFVNDADEKILDMDSMNKITKINGSLFINSKDVSDEINKLRQYSETKIDSSLRDIQKSIIEEYSESPVLVKDTIVLSELNEAIKKSETQRQKSIVNYSKDFLKSKRNMVRSELNDLRQSNREHAKRARVMTNQIQRDFESDKRNIMYVQDEIQDLSQDSINDMLTSDTMFYTSLSNTLGILKDEIRHNQMTANRAIQSLIDKYNRSLEANNRRARELQEQIDKKDIMIQTLIQGTKST